MKIWVLRPVELGTGGNNPWEPWYDKAFGFVVRCETEQQAREIAQEHGGDETTIGDNAWLDEKYSTCVELVGEGVPGVVMVDFANA